MRLPRMSTGAWIFTTALTVTLIGAPAAVYASVASHVAIGNPGNTTTALVDPEQQLLTAGTPAKNIVHIVGGVSQSGCALIYTPPAGKALMITSVSFDVGSGSTGTESDFSLTNGGCSTFYEIADTMQGYDVQTRAFPTGLPVPSIGVYAGLHVNNDGVYVTGYLIPASQLPPPGQVSHISPRTFARLKRAAARNH